MFYFVCAVVACVVFLYLPGYIVLRRTTHSAFFSMTCAPVISVFMFTVVALIYSLLNVFSSAVSASVCVFAVALGFNFLGRRFLTGMEAARHEYNLIRYGLLAVLVGSLVAAYVFLDVLHGASALCQTYDNIHQYGVARSFLVSGNWSVFDVSLYSVPSGSTPVFYEPGSYYPAAWNLLVALVVSATSVPLAIAANALNYVILSVVYPLGMLSIVASICKPTDSRLASCALLASIAGAFPWMLVETWPLFPNAFSLAVSLPLISAFIAFAGQESSFTSRVIFGFVFLIGVFTGAFMQPNAVFTLGVFLAPYLVFRVFCFGRDRFSIRVGWLLSTASVIMIAGLWFICYKLPFLQVAVSYYWPPVGSVGEMVLDAFICGYTLMPPQPVLALLIAAGVLAIFRLHLPKWPLVSYLLAVLIFVASASLEDVPLKHLLSGFWYTDPYRTGAMLGMVSIPIAMLGSSYILDSVLSKADAVFSGVMVRRVRIAVSICFFAILFCASYSDLAIRGDRSVPLTQFSQIRSIGYGQYYRGTGSPYSYEKSDFVEKVQKKLGKDAVVMNLPFDGSMYSYSCDGLNVVYRYISRYDEDSEWAGSSVIRENLNEIANNAAVQEAVRDTGAKYFMTLGDDLAYMEAVYPTFDAEDWKGFLGIGDSTPGFDLVMSEGNMKLYSLSFD